MLTLYKIYIQIIHEGSWLDYHTQCLGEICYGDEKTVTSLLEDHEQHLWYLDDLNNVDKLRNPKMLPTKNVLPITTITEQYSIDIHNTLDVLWISRSGTKYLHQLNFMIKFDMNYIENNWPLLICMSPQVPPNLIRWICNLNMNFTIHSILPPLFDP